MNRAIPPAIYPPDIFEVTPPVRMILGNGVSVNIINSLKQEITRMDLVFNRAGTWQQRYPLQALFTNRMLKEGTKSRSSADIAERLDYHGSWLELSCSSEHAFVTVYFLNKYAQETLEIVEEMIKEPVFPLQELLTVTETNRQQFIVNMSQARFLSHRALAKALYGETHPVGMLTSERHYHDLNPDMLRSFHQEHYHCDNCTIFLSGNVSDKVMGLVSRFFGKPFGTTSLSAQTPQYVIHTNAEKRVMVPLKQAAQCAVSMGCISISRDNPDYMGFLVLVTLFGGYFGSRLMSNIREKKGYTYGISAGLVFYPDSGMLVISSQADPKYVEPMIGEVYHEIDRLRTEPIPQDELEMVRNYMLGDLCRNYESPFGISDAWIMILTSKVGEDYFARFSKVINQITPEQLTHLARKYLCPQALKVVVAGNFHSKTSAF